MTQQFDELALNVAMEQLAIVHEPTIKRFACRLREEWVKSLEPVAWCVAYDDPAFGRIHSNPTMSKMQAEAIIENAAAQLVLCELFTNPAPADEKVGPV